MSLKFWALKTVFLTLNPCQERRLNHVKASLPSLFSEEWRRDTDWLSSNCGCVPCHHIWAVMIYWSFHQKSLGLSRLLLSLPSVPGELTSSRWCFIIFAWIFLSSNWHPSVMKLRAWWKVVEVLWLYTHFTLPISHPLASWAYLSAPGSIYNHMYHCCPKLQWSWSTWPWIPYGSAWMLFSWQPPVAVFLCMICKF
jgi:hypothetical protein